MAKMQNDSQPLYFWRESDPTTGWLSQWYFCPFRDDQDPEKVYFTAEHYMMHQKALLFHDAHSAALILATKHPRAAKALGRKVARFDEATWRARREAIVRRGTELKFTRAVTEAGFRRGTAWGDLPLDLPLLEAPLRMMLLRTGERELVEASPYDFIWGIGFRERDAEGLREEWGENLLGKALMDVRRGFREEDRSEGEGEGDVEGGR